MTECHYAEQKSQTSLMRFMVDVMATGQGVLQVLCFFVSVSFHKCSVLIHSTITGDINLPMDSVLK
jgi:hypothetical protein